MAEASAHSLLLVDDEHENLEFLRRVFRGTYTVHTAQRGDEALALLQEKPVDLLLTDFRMPGMNGAELLEAARRVNPNIVRIVLSGYADSEDIIAAVNRGEALRYLTKPIEVGELKLAVAQALETYRWHAERAGMLDKLRMQNEALEQTSAELRSLNERLEARVAERTRELEQSNAKLTAALAGVTQLARTDPLTNVWNRRYTFEMAERELERADRYASRLAFLMVDIDHFKGFNDTLGHQAGDRALARLGEILAASVRSIDVCGRYGGEEFMIILPQTDEIGARRVAERILKGARQVAPSTEQPIQPFTVSIGLSLYPEHGKTLEDLIGAADGALYRAKAGGRDRLEVAP